MVTILWFHFTIPLLVTPDMVMSFPLYISSFQKVRFYFKTEIEGNVLGSWTHECSTPEISGIEKITGYMIMKKSGFTYWLLVFKLLNSDHDTWFSSEIQQL